VRSRDDDEIIVSARGAMRSTMHTPRVSTLVLVFVTGCTSTAGPFITNISSAGPGRIRVEKCEVEFSVIGYSHIENGACTTETLDVERP
jgi:hypothetical protein